MLSDKKIQIARAKENLLPRPYIVFLGPSFLSLPPSPFDSLAINLSSGAAKKDSSSSTSKKYISKHVRISPLSSSSDPLTASSSFPFPGETKKAQKCEEKEKKRQHSGNSKVATCSSSSSELRSSFFISSSSSSHPAMTSATTRIPK